MKPIVLRIAMLFVCQSCRSAPAQPRLDMAADPSARLDWPVVQAGHVMDPEASRIAAMIPGSERNATVSVPLAQAIASLDAITAQRVAVGEDETTYASSLRALLSGDPKSAALGFDVVRRRAHSGDLRELARVGRTIALSWASDWEALVEMANERGTTAGGSVGTDHDQSTVEAWARAFEGRAPSTIHIPDSSVTVPLRMSRYGTPLVTVLVNGHSRELLLDTGASMSLLAAGAAESDGVTVIASDPLSLGTEGGTVPARAAVVKALEIGSIALDRVPVAVVPDRTLRFAPAARDGGADVASFDGVIGADVLRGIDITIDLDNGTLLMRRPAKATSSERNLFWIGYPVVRVRSQDGHELLFGLDTGAEQSYVTALYLEKMPETRRAAKSGGLVGIGGGRLPSHEVAHDVELHVLADTLRLPSVPVIESRQWVFVDLDGVLGSDITRAGRMHLDFANGIFEVMGHGRAGPPVV